MRLSSVAMKATPTNKQTNKKYRLTLEVLKVGKKLCCVFRYSDACLIASYEVSRQAGSTPIIPKSWYTELLVDDVLYASHPALHSQCKLMCFFFLLCLAVGRPTDDEEEKKKNAFF